MDNKELLEEIRMNRKEIASLREEFFIFKGKAFGFISVITFIVTFAMDYIKRKL